MPGGAGACRGGEEGWGDGETRLFVVLACGAGVGNPRKPRDEGGSPRVLPSPEQKAPVLETCAGRHLPQITDRVG